MFLNAWPIGHCSSGRCGLVEVGVAMLEQVYHCGPGMEVSYAQAMTSVGPSSHPVACRLSYRTLNC